MGYLKSNHAVKVDFFTLDRRERVSSAEKSEYLLLLFLPGQLRNVQVLDEELLVVIWR